MERVIYAEGLYTVMKSIRSKSESLVDIAVIPLFSIVERLTESFVSSLYLNFKSELIRISDGVRGSMVTPKFSTHEIASRCSARMLILSGLLFNSLTILFGGISNFIVASIIISLCSISVTTRVEVYHMIFLSSIFWKNLKHDSANFSKLEK